MPDTISDPLQRLQYYRVAFKFYIDHFPRISKILFVENSGWPLTEIQAIIRTNPYDKQIEYISLDINNFPREFGKGYGELTMISAALKQSELIQQAKFIVKVTGKLIIPNLSKLLKQMNSSIELLCDFRDHPFYEWLQLPKNGRYCDTRLIIFTPEFFEKNLEKLNNNHTHGEFCIEHEFYQIIKPFDDGKKVICRFPIEAQYRGIAGHYAKNYSGWKELCKQTIRNFFRKVCPWLRI